MVTHHLYVATLDLQKFQQNIIFIFLSCDIITGIHINNNQIFPSWTSSFK